jgi:molecular chaperone GrpE
MTSQDASQAEPQEQVKGGKDKSTKRTFVPIAEVSQLQDALQNERKRNEECMTRLKYLQADFENLQKRSKKEIEESVKYGETDLAIRLLPVLDDLERALAASKNSDNKDAVVGGVEMILKAAQNVLFSKGLAPIDAVGKKFDPAKHEAAGYVSSSDHEDNTIIRELRKGYMFCDKVIRPSIVEVARKASSEKT